MDLCPIRHRRVVASVTALGLLAGAPGAAPLAAATAQTARGDAGARAEVMGVTVAAPGLPALGHKHSGGVFDGAPAAGGVKADGGPKAARRAADARSAKDPQAPAPMKNAPAPRRSYAAFEASGRLRWITATPAPNGPQLELEPDGRGGLRPTRDASGELSAFNRAHAALFSKAPTDGFQAAVSAVAGRGAPGALGPGAPAAGPAKAEPASALAQLWAAATSVAAGPAPVPARAATPPALAPAPAAAAPRAAAAAPLPAYDEDKLAEARDLAHPNDESARLLELRALLDQYQGSLVDRSGAAPGAGDELSLREAADRALREQLGRFGTAAPGGVSGTPADPAVVKRIDELVTRVETLRGEASADMAERDAVRQLLAVQDRLRGAALRDRRSGKEMLQFHENLSRLDSVMSIALSLNEITAAQKAISDMLSLIDAKVAKINASRQQNQQNLQQAQQNQQLLQQWKDQAAATIKSDKDTQQSMVDDEGEAAMAVDRIGAFQRDVSALIAAINARDGGGKNDALKEYQRRIDLLPTVAQWRTSGNPNDPSAFSLKGFQDDLAQVDSYIKQANDGLAQLPTVPVEFAGAVILLAPGPAVSVKNPTRAQTLQILADRKAYWTAQQAVYAQDLASIDAMMDASNAQSSIDEFGDASPKSLPRYRAQQADIETRSQASVAQYLSQIDAAAAQVNSVAGSDLPPLSGLSLAQLKDSLLAYGDKVRAVSIPDANSSPAAHLASMNLITIAKLLPYAADGVIQWAKADAVIQAIDSALATTLPTARAKLAAVVAMFDAVLADVDADTAYVNGGGEGNQALLDRKLSLLRDTIMPPLQGARSLLADTLIPYQQGSIAQAQPKTGDLYTLFTSQQTLMNTAKQLYDQDLPWAVATFGGSSADKPGSHAKIASWRQHILDNLNGYDDAQGHHEGVLEYKVEIQRRKDPDYAGTEVLYGETQPYSLPRKISQYSAERAQRVQQFNAQAAQLNEIEGRIEAVSKGKYDLHAYRFPTGVADDPAGVARVQAIVDANLIPNLADQLKAIGDAENAGGSDIDLGAGASTPPVGVQPPITLPDAQQIALLALDAAKRLVPSSLQQPETAPAAYAVARILYSDSVVSAAKDALANQVPAAELFLSHAEAALNGAVDATRKSDAFVDAGGGNETADQTYARMLAMFGTLDAFLKEGIAFFNLKGQWDQSSLNGIDKVGTYYSSLNDIYTGGGTANDSELQAAQQMKATLQKTFDSLQATRVKLTGWMAQLNDPTESALRRVNESISDLQEKTRAVLESNIKWHDLDDQLKRSEDILRAKLTQTDDAQQELAALLEDPAVRGQVRDGLPVELVNRVEALRLSRGAWSIGGAASPQAIVVRKSQYSAFLDTVLHALQGQASTLNLAAVKQDLLQNPAGLSQLIPGSQLMDFGNDADGFYLVYQTKFSVPNGLNTESSVTLGNVARLWGSNVSVTGYQFGSPPNDANAPYGDKGVDVTVETLQGKNWVNYLDVDFHRFAFDLPPDGTALANARASRLMIFDDFAVMLFGDKLYVGLAGFGDFALDNPKDHPYYYGGNLKTSLKLTEVMKLNAEQQVLFAKDPRTFFQQVNLDFTGYDPDLNKDWNIVARGDDKDYYRTQLGPSFDIARLMGQKDAFTLDLFWSRTAGTDDINQQALGFTILKGFSLRDANGKPWAVINNQTTAEAGQQYNTLTDRLSITFPDQGIVISGQGKLLGSAKAYYGEISKKMGDNSTISVGYGSPYVGLNDRLSIMMNTSFTLGQLWQAVVDGARTDLHGGEQLASFNRNLDDFFKDGNDGTPDAQVQELRRVFEQDVARKLISQDIGTLRREIDELRKAGAFLDNTRVRGMVGFVSSPVSEDEADRASGGGFTAGSQTELTLTKTQKALIDAKAQTLFREGLRLQERLLSLTKDWQSAVAEIAKAQWDLKLATFMLDNAGSEALRGQARVLVAEAEARLHQAVLRYNALSGRAPGDPVPFDNLSAADLETLMGSIRSTIAAPDRLYDILKSLDPSEMKKQLGDNPFNLVDWLPIIDKLTVGVGTQLQDMMANQVFTAGVTVRLPVYDPSSKAADKSYQFESKAAIAEMAQAEAERGLRAQKELEQARLAKLDADAGRPGLRKSAQDLSLAIRAYRNGLIEPSRLQTAFDNWRWYAGSVLDADTTSALAAVWAAADGKVLGPQPYDGSVVRVSDLSDAYALVNARSQSLAEVALRQQAAAEMAQSNDHRIQKVFLDVTVGWGFTASGVGWLPSIGITGVPVTPMLGFVFKPEELRELQVAQGKGQTEYYARLKKKLEAGLALEFYQNVVAYKTAQGALDLFDNSLLPQLRAELASKQAAGASEVDLTAARRALDDAGARREQAELALRQSAATMNFLLGRPGDAALQVDLDPKAALASLKQVLAQTDPVGNEQGLLAARVGVARAVETMVDKDLKSEQLALEPVSMVVRSLGRLIDALGSDSVGNPELVAAARVQTLTEERAQEAFPKQVAAQTARAFTSLGLVRAELHRLADKADPESKLRYQALSAQELDLIGVLMSLGVDVSRPPSAGEKPLPSSFADLAEKLAQAEEAMAAEASEKPVEVLDPGSLSHQAAGFLRYYYANQTLGHVPIDRSYAESWIEVRLKRGDSDPETLLKLAELRKEKADKLYGLQLAGARADGEILAADFETEVQMLRWAMRTTSAPGGVVKGSLDEFSRQLRLRLSQRRDEICALLGLSPATTLEDLMALVPAEASGSGDLGTLSRDFVGRVRALQLDEVRRTLFDGGLPAGLGAEDDLIHQLRADTIAERMSYKGFTPVAAFGVFRGRQIGGLFMEAPDPREIQNGLRDVLSETLRKELEASGALQELSLALHQLMARVEDGAKELEQRRALVEAAEADYAAQMGRVTDASRTAEVEAARERLVDAWLGFSRQMVRTKADFVALVEELEALGQGRETALSPLPGARLELPALRTAPKEALLSYWTDRLLDPDYRASFEAQLDALGARVPPPLRAALERELGLYQTAARDGAAVLARDFDASEKLDLLTRNDKEGKREALAGDLGRLLDLCGGLSDKDDPLVAALLADLDARAQKDRAAREDFEALGHATRQAQWDALAAPPEAKAAQRRVEALRQSLLAARQALLESYLAQSADGPVSFIMKDRLLDAYLKAQQAYDDELIKAFQLPCVKADRELAWRLDGLFDFASTARRQMDAARSGRGLLALDALIMLEESRLQALRWQGRGPRAIDEAALSLQRLRDKRQAWTRGASDLEPLYAETPVSKDGVRQPAVERWVTAAELAGRLKSGLVTEKDGRYFTQTPDGPRELVGGEDAAEARLVDARRAAAADDRALAAAGRLADFDAVLDAPLADGRGGYSVDELYGPGGLQSQGRLFYFERPGPGEPGGRLHRALHPLLALSRSPADYAVFVYTGGLALARDRYPTLESLAASPEAPDFHELTLSARGAAALSARALSQRAAELRSGWIDVKLNSYGFARDAHGDIVELYLTQDDLDAQKKAFLNAAADLAQARRDLSAAEAKAAAAKSAMQAAQERAQTAGLEYQAVQQRRRAALSQGVSKSEADRRLVEDKEYKDAQKRFDPVAKAAMKAQDDWRAADAAVINARKALDDAALMLERSRTWSLYVSKDVTLSIDRQGGVVEAAGSPVYGSLRLDDTIPGGPAAFTMRGELLAAALDKDGRLVRYYQDPKAVAADAPSWSLKTVELGDSQALPAGSTEVAPRYRLAHYEVEGPGGPAPVLLSRRFMIERAEAAKKGLDRAANYGLLPWNWADLVLELPRGIVDAPVELITGRDPRQQHYLGRVYMYKTEGGLTERHGFFRKALGVVDVLDLLPDPVQRFYDPSQFPDTVRVDSPVLPGQSVFQKDPTTLDGKHDVHYGVGALAGARRESLEDLTAARERTLSRFHGGVETTLVETVRGRNGPYIGSEVLASSGRKAIEDALRDPVVSSDPRSDGSGTVISSEDPGNIAVDRVEKRVTVRAGADQLRQQADALKGYSDILAQRLAALREERGTLEQQAADAQSAFDGSVRRRSAAYAAVAGAGVTGGAAAGSVPADEPSPASPRGARSASPAAPPVKGKLDMEWWQRFLAGFGLLALLGGAAYLAGEKKPEPVVAPGAEIEAA